MTTIRNAIHNIEKRRGNIRELTTAEIVLELEAEIAKEEPEGVTADIDDLIMRYAMLVRFTTNYKKIIGLLTDFSMRIPEYTSIKQPGLREELIKFIKYRENNDPYTAIVNIEKYTDEYLKQSKSK